jgi:hypothetical protein
VSEWLDLMLQEIARKQHEEHEAQQEMQRREMTDKNVEQKPAPRDAQSK